MILPTKISVVLLPSKITPMVHVTSTWFQISSYGNSIGTWCYDSAIQNYRKPKQRENLCSYIGCTADVLQTSVNYCSFTCLDESRSCWWGRLSYQKLGGHVSSGMILNPLPSYPSAAKFQIQNLQNKHQCGLLEVWITGVVQMRQTKINISKL